MRTITTALAEMVAKYGVECQTRAQGIWMKLRDGTILGVTDHDRNLTATMTDEESVTLLTGPGMKCSDITLACGLDADNFEISGPLSSTFTRSGVIGGRFSGARVRVFGLDWSGGEDVIPYMEGWVGDCRIEGSTYVFEVRSAMDRYNQTIGRLLSPYCSADYGDTLCGVTRTTYAATITAVHNDFIFTVDLGGSYEDDFFKLGSVAFTSGALAGTQEVEIFDFDGTGILSLFAPLAARPQVGDELTVFRGCSKLKRSDDATIPTCATNENVMRFRGFDQVPGSDTYLRPAVPGQGNSAGSGGSAQGIIQQL